MNLPKIETKKAAIGFGITAAGILLVLLLDFTAVLDPIELATVDFRFEMRGPLSGITAVEPIPQDSLDVVLVMVDDESYRLLPWNWPYPRGDAWARCIRNLARAGASVIVFDIQFDSDWEDPAQDSILADAIREAEAADTRIVLGAKYSVEKTRVPPDNIAMPNKVLMDANPETGLVGEVKDTDGVTRRSLLFSYLSYDTLLYLSLGLKAVKEFYRYPDDVKLEPAEGGIQYGDTYIMTHGRTNTFLVNYYGPPSNAGPPPPVGPWKTFGRYPLSGVLDDEDFTLKDENEDIDWMEFFFEDGLYASFGMSEESPFKNKIVLVGVEVEVLLDLKETPYYNYFGIQQMTPGVETHANAIQTIIDGNYIYEIGSFGKIGWMLLLSLVTFTIVMLFGPVKGGAVAFVVALAYLDGAMGLFFRDYLWLPKALVGLLPGFILEKLGTAYVINVPGYAESTLAPVTLPITGIFVAYSFNVLYQFVMEQTERRKIKNMFSTYVSPAVLQHLQDNPDAFGLSGQKMPATMFFSDVAGFTSISEKLSAEDLAKVLNRYLSPMTEILMSYDGYVDKYEGDAIMCDFGVPVPDEDHAWKACFAALDQQDELTRLREEIKDEYGVEIYVRMGLNSGDVSAGNMGSAQRFQYTVMGDAVNQASRFEGANKQYDTDIMIGESTLKLANDKIEARLLDHLVVKGKVIPIPVYELISRKGEISDEMNQVRTLFEEGLKLHFERKWDEAIARFNDALKIKPTDGPSLKYIERCNNYKETPPPDEWQGEFVMTTK